MTLGYYVAVKAGTDERVKLNLKVTTTVSFEQNASVAAGKPVVPVLRALHNYVTDGVIKPVLDGHL